MNKENDPEYVKLNQKYEDAKTELSKLMQKYKPDYKAVCHDKAYWRLAQRLNQAIYQRGVYIEKHYPTRIIFNLTES